MHHKHPSDFTPVVSRRNAYWALAATTFAVSFAALLMSTFPLSATAFWSFFTPAQGAEETLTLHDASLPLLQAALNPDPNPSKGGSEIALSEGSALLANAGYEGTAAVYKESKETTGQISLYVVREGDALSDIASMFGVSTNTILWANDLKSAKDIHEGDTLLILPVSGVRHTVLEGQTLNGIAKKYGADVGEVASFNGLEVGADLQKGETLIIPGGDLAQKSTSSKKSGGSAVKGPSQSLPAISGYFGNPVPGARLTQGIHGYNGIDLGAKAGTPVYASAAGTVIVAKGGGGYNGGYGNYVVISHANGTQTLYAHLTSVMVSVGQSVAQGEQIGTVGNTGRSTGFHLHFEVRGAANPFAR